jgi:uncharacterized membrane protein YciS (DUF1049 family)
MKWVKWITISLILAIIALFIYQNLPVFDSPTTFVLDLHFREFQWSHQLYTIFGIGALLGFILGILLMLKPHLKVRRKLSEERQAKEQLREQQKAHETIQTEEKPRVHEATPEQTVSSSPAAPSGPGPVPPASTDS